MQCLIAAMVLAMAAAAPPPPQGPAGAPQTQSAVFDFSRDAHDRLTLGVHIGNGGPFAFLVDTGAERTVISRELAERLALAPGRPITLRSVLGSSLVETVDIPTLQVGVRRIDVTNAPSLPFENIGAAGILGVDILASQRVVLDFQRRTMTLTPSRSAPARMEGTTIVVEARRRYGRLLFTNAVIDSRSAVVVIDTGSEISIGNLALGQKLGRDRRVKGTVQIETVLGEKVTAEVATIHNLDIGSVTLKDMNIAFLDASIFRQLKIDDKPALLLGMNAMRAFDLVSVDFATGKVRFVLPGTSRQFFSAGQN